VAEKQRDWDKEMAEVDRLLNKLPHAEPTLGRSSGGERTVKKPGVSGGGGVPSHGDWLGTWAKVALGVLVGVGVTPGVWPYTHGCGLRLIFYLVGVAALIAAGVWAGVSSWRRRLGVAHVIAQVLIVWGAILATHELLPRVGTGGTAVWLCPDVPPSH
jgi:hypothetical protein